MTNKNELMKVAMQFSRDYSILMDLANELEARCFTIEEVSTTSIVVGIPVDRSYDYGGCYGEVRGLASNLPCRLYFVANPIQLNIKVAVIFGNL